MTVTGYGWPWSLTSLNFLIRRLSENALFQLRKISILQQPDELVKLTGWLSKNFDKQDVVVLQARDHTCSMSSVWRTTTTQDIETFYDAINNLLG